jgi:hypothetical protein
MRTPLWFVFVAGCGGGVPLLHEAHVLPPGGARAGAGFSGTFATGDASVAMGEARSAATGTTTAPKDTAFALGAAAAIGMAPGIAPWVGARVGLPGENEAGLTYTGRVVRIDGRHAFQNETTALSIGPGLSLFAGPGTGGDAVPNLDWTARRLGVDLPVLLGWRSSAGIVSGWGGARAGIESTTGTVTLAIQDPPRSGDLALTRWYFGAVVGLAIGFRHLHAALELDASYSHVSATLAGIAAKTSGVTLSPATALILTF